MDAPVSYKPNANMARPSLLRVQMRKRCRTTWVRKVRRRGGDGEEKGRRRGGEGRGREEEREKRKRR